MRRKVTKAVLEDFMRMLAIRVKGQGSVFFAGGSSVLMLGLRDQTIDIDLKVDPEPVGVFEAIKDLKEELGVNVELASPGDFIPAPDNWRLRSLFISTIDDVKFFHYDLTLQALAKIERGHTQDLKDVYALIENKFITATQVSDRFADISPRLIRYPALDPKDFENRVNLFLQKFKKNEQ